MQRGHKRQSGFIIIYNLVGSEVFQPNAAEISTPWVGLKTSNIFLLLSSRASHELVVKTALAGIGTLVTISAATTMARDLAVKANINLIGFVRGSKQIVYNEAES